MASACSFKIMFLGKGSGTFRKWQKVVDTFTGIKSLRINSNADKTAEFRHKPFIPSRDKVFTKNEKRPKLTGKIGDDRRISLHLSFLASILRNDNPGHNFEHYYKMVETAIKVGRLIDLSPLEPTAVIDID